MKKVPILCALMLCGAQAANAAVYTGTCGASQAACSWSFNDVSGEFTISGNGAMTDWPYSTNHTRPWYDYRTSIKSVVISGVKTIGAYTFFGFREATQVVIPSSVTSIGTWAFGYWTKMTQVTIPNSVTSIGEAAFSYCSNLTQITIPNGITSIDKGVFYGCLKLVQVTIPSGVTSIGVQAFSDCNALTSVTIPSGVTSIGVEAFTSCYALTSVTIPSSVTSIGSTHTFSRCTSLTQIICLMPTPASINANFFTNVPRNIPLYVPAGAVPAYKNAEVWKTFTNILPVPNVTFNSQGGTAVATQTLVPNTKATKPADPAKNDYAFCGWYRESSCTNEWNFSTHTIGTSDITLYAKWLPNKITVTYKCVGTGCNSAFGEKKVDVPRSP